MQKLSMVRMMATMMTAMMAMADTTSMAQATVVQTARFMKATG